MRDRMAVVHNRSLGYDGRMAQARPGFPQFVLEEVLDIIDSRRMAKLRASFKDIDDLKPVYELQSGYRFKIIEVQTLEGMSLVHRSSS